MKAKVEIVQVYSITVEGETYEGCKIMESWEGMTKFSLPNGKLVILDTEGIHFLLSGMFGQPVECPVVKASPSVAKELVASSAEEHF